MPSKSLKPILNLLLLSTLPFITASQDNAVAKVEDSAAVTVEAQKSEPPVQAESSNKTEPSSIDFDPELVVSEEDRHRIKQMDEAIEKALPLRDVTNKIGDIVSNYEEEITKIDKDSAVTEDILSKYRPLIEQILRNLSVVSEKEKSNRLGTRTAEMVKVQRRKLDDILKKIEETVKAPQNELNVMSTTKVEQILTEISDALKENKDENGQVVQDNSDEQIAKMLSITQELSVEVDKTILKDQYVLNFISQKREERKKNAWNKLLNLFNENSANIRKIVDESDQKLQPLTSENVEQLRGRVEERAAGLRRKMARVVWQYAQQWYANGKYSEAKDAWEESRKIYSSISLDISKFQEKSSLKSEILSKIQKNSEKQLDTIVQMQEKCEKGMATVDFREQTSLETIDSGRDQRLNDINTNMAQAELLIKNEEYMRARDCLEMVLIRDPYNMKATKMLKELYEKLHDSGRNRRYNEYLETLAVNEWNWNEAVLPRPADKPAQELVTKQTDRSSIASKLNDIIIPRIEFDDTSLNSVVQYLSRESQANDTSVDRTGVQIMLNLSSDQVSQIPTITMGLDDIPIGEAIRYICQYTGLKFRVEDRAVIISSDITAVMDTRSFKVRATTIKTIAPAAETEKKEMGEDMLSLDATFSEEVTKKTGNTSVTSEQL
ncbi:MAG TPA: hypothetical protein PK821_05840, partial [Victivallales bacterium]|nr:hypothetical protein [Victivallales bacterium]